MPLQGPRVAEPLTAYRGGTRLPHFWSLSVRLFSTHPDILLPNLPSKPLFLLQNPTEHPFPGGHPQPQLCHGNLSVLTVDDVYPVPPRLLIDFLLIALDPGLLEKT